MIERKKLLINALPYKQESSGIGILIGELFSRVCRETSLDTTVVLDADSPELDGGEQVREVRPAIPYSRSAVRIFFQSFCMAPRYGKNAVILTTDSKIPLLLPGGSRILTLVTDLAVFRMGEVYKRSRTLLWRAQYAYLRHRGGTVTAISEFTRRECAELLGIPAEKIEVIYPACSDLLAPAPAEAQRALREKYSLPKRYFLFVGSCNPRKNLERLLRAFDRFKEETHEEHELVIAGAEGWRFDREGLLNTLHWADAIRFLGYVPETEKAALYSGAEAFLFPSLYEGFGIPVLEAHSCGTPVLTSDGSALRETGGEAALYVDPTDEDDILRGMETLAGSEALRRELTERGFENVKRFSWEASARKLCALAEKEALL